MNPVTLLVAAFGQGTTIVAEQVPAPGYPWYLCPVCFETQQRRAAKGPRCIMSPRCPGVLEVYLICRCEGCGAPLTGRSRDGRFCKAKCRRMTPWTEAL